MSDRITSHGTVKGHHAKPGDAVTEGGAADAPKLDGGTPKPAASKAAAEGVPDDDTSSATAATEEKRHAAEAGAGKTQSGRGHRKSEAGG